MESEAVQVAVGSANRHAAGSRGGRGWPRVPAEQATANGTSQSAPICVLAESYPRYLTGR